MSNRLAQNSRSPETGGTLTDNRVNLKKLRRYCTKSSQKSERASNLGILRLCRRSNVSMTDELKQMHEMLDFDYRNNVRKIFRSFRFQMDRSICLVVKELLPNRYMIPIRTAQ